MIFYDIESISFATYPLGWLSTMNTFLNFETYIPLTDFETVTNIKCQEEQELSSLTKSEKP